MKRQLLIGTVAALAAATMLGSGMSTQPAPAQARTPQEQSVNFYNDGIRAREKAWKMEKELTTEQDAGKQARLQEKIQKSYENAVRLQRKATDNNPNMFQAFGELGYALRKSGHFSDALVAYDHALELQPNFAEAIEYRGEAYLGLNRVDDVKVAYLTLFNGGDKPGAAKLSSAMVKWVDAHRTSAGDVPQQQIDDFAKWVSQRSEITTQSASVSGATW
ncbi:MAG: tetratricopeptide repeat protein [Acidobacteriota bacterium]